MSENPDLDRAFELHDEEKLSEALEAYRASLAHEETKEAHNNIGVILDEMGKYPQAAHAYKEALRLNEDYSLARRNLGRAYAQQDLYFDSYTAYLRALDTDPEDQLAHKGVGEALVGMFGAGEKEQAAEKARVWQDNYPDNPFMNHIVPIILGESIPERANDGYVTAIFDEFASSFDKVLAELEYQAPDLIAEEITKHLPEPARNLQVLDAGCGTGLCGPFLKPYADSLVGVDLSGDMLAQARDRLLYDDLLQRELTEFLNENKDSYDVIVSADVLCYFGSIDAVFEASCGAMKKGGLMAFTVESVPDDEEKDYILQDNGRYKHSADYLKRLFNNDEMELVAFKDDVILRKEQGTPVPGLLSVLRKR